MYHFNFGYIAKFPEPRRHDEAEGDILYLLRCPLPSTASLRLYGGAAAYLVQRAMFDCVVGMNQVALGDQFPEIDAAQHVIVIWTTCEVSCEGVLRHWWFYH